MGIYTQHAFELYLNGEQVLTGTAGTEAAYHRISLPIHQLPSGSIVVAASVHATEACTDDFKGFFGFIVPTSNRIFDGSCDSNHADDITTEGMANAYDNHRNTKWYASALPAYNTYIFNNRREFINAYSITTTGGMTERRPTQWTVYGSNDGEEWIVIDKRDEIHFTAMYQTKTFTLPSHATAYAQYKIEFTAVESGTALEVGMIQFLIDNVAYVTTPVLSYPSTIELFVGQTDINILPATGGFQNFQIAPALPNGLSFSTVAGTIYGSPSTATSSAGSYQITATHVTTGSTSYTATISLSVITCGTAKTRVDIVKYDAGLGSVEQWSLLSGETVIDTQIGRDIFASQAASEQTFSYCLTPGKYSLYLTQKYGKGWHKSTYIDVRVYLDNEETMNVLHYNLLPAEKEATIEFNTAILMNNDMSSWGYKADGTIPSDWTASTTTASFTPIPTERPSVSQSVWLLRRSITVDSITGFMGFELRVFARAGVIVYLNGNEYFRVGVTGSLTGSSTSTSTSTTPAWKYFYGRVGTGHLIAGQNTIAIAIVNANNAEATLDTKVSLRLTTLYSLSEGLDTTVTDSSHESDTTVGANLFHGDYSARYKAPWANTNLVITATFNGAAYVNTYCTVYSWNSPDNAPKKWTVATSTDGTSFTNAVTVDNNSYNHPYERRCFTFSSSQAIRAFRFTIEAPVVSTSSNMQLLAIDLFYMDSAQMTIPSLAYSSPAMSIYAGASVYLEPTSSAYYDFSISPALPEGLLIEGNGIIRGQAASAAEQLIYTISAKDLSGSGVTTVLGLTIESCSNDKSIIRFTTGDTSSAGHRMVVILNSLDDTLFMNDNIADYSAVNDWAWCLPNDVYTFTLIDREGSSWSNQYNVYLNSAVTTGNVNSGTTPVKVTISSLQYISQGTHTYEYQIPNDSTPTNYYLKDTTRNWTTGKPGDFPPPTKYTSLFCTTFEARSIDMFATVVFGVKVKGGFIMYLNGQEMNRVHLPATTTFNTAATAEFEEDIFVEYYEPAQLSAVLVEGENFVCVEVHKKTVNTDEDNTFDMYIRPVAAGRDIIIDGEVSASSIGYYNSPYDERYFNTVDKNTNNKWYNNANTCENVWVKYVFNNERKDYANAFTYYQGNNSNRKPKNIAIKGSNNPSDEDSWENIFYSETATTPTGYGYSQSFNFYPDQPYNAYLFVFNGCGSEGIEVGEILLYANMIEGDYCRPQNGIKGAIEGATAYGPCEEGYTGDMIYTCMNGEFVYPVNQCVPAAPKDLKYPQDEYNLMTKEAVSIVPTFFGKEVTFSSLPAMPEGLTLDTKTGVISGTPKAASATTRHIILCKNDSGNVQTTLTITVTEKPTPVWVYIVIAVVAILVIVGIVFGIIAAVKSSKKSKGKGKKPAPKKQLPKVQPKAPAAAGAAGAAAPKKIAV